MHKIIEAQGPSGCNTDIGNLKTDILAPRDGVIEEIDCLRLNRLARTAGAPIDKGAGIKVFKKIGDRVEQGEPLYRIYAFDDAQFELAQTGAKADSGYEIGAHVRRRREQAVTGNALQCLPSAADAAKRLAKRLGHFHARDRGPPLSRWGVARDRRPGVGNHDRLSHRSISRTTSCWRCCLPAKPSA